MMKSKCGRQVLFQTKVHNYFKVCTKYNRNKDRAGLDIDYDIVKEGSEQWRFQQFHLVIDSWIMCCHLVNVASHYYSTDSQQLCSAITVLTSISIKPSTQYAAAINSNCAVILKIMNLIRLCSNESVNGNDMSKLYNYKDIILWQIADITFE